MLFDYLMIIMLLCGAYSLKKLASSFMLLHRYFPSHCLDPIKFNMKDITPKVHKLSKGFCCTFSDAILVS